MINIEIGGIIITDIAGYDIKQTYSSVDGGSSLLRSMNGTGIKQTRWEKIKITTTGTGWIPPALQTLDTNAQQVMKCTAPMHSQSASNVITISADRRTDTGSEPFGLAFVNGNWIDTPCAMSVNQATLTAVAGATLYRACWYPEYTVYADRVVDDGDLGGPYYSWSFTAEQA